MEETLFGVTRGQLLGLTVSPGWDQDGNHQSIGVVFHWQNRKPSAVAVYPPDDTQIAHFLAIFMPVIMHSQWQASNRLRDMVRAAIRRCETDGAEVAVKGTKFA